MSLSKYGKKAKAGTYAGREGKARFGRVLEKKGGVVTDFPVRKLQI